MKLGSSTARFWLFERSMLKVLEYISAYLKVAEIWVEPPFYPNWRTTREKADLDRLLDVLVVTELETTVHAPHHELSLCSWNPAVNSLTLKEIEKSLDMAAELGAKAVTFHAGKMRFSDVEGKAILRSNLEILDELAQDYSARLCLENPHDGYCSRIEDLVDIVSGLKNIYVTLDLGHLSVQKVKLADYKRKLRGRIKNVHLSKLTVDGKHEPVLSETKFMKDSLKTLEEMKYRGAVILEGFAGENPDEIIPKEIAVYRKMIR